MLKRVTAVMAAALALVAIAFGLGAAPASAVGLPDTWTSADSAHHADGGYMTCSVKWHGHSSGIDSWTPIAVAFTDHAPGVLVDYWSVAHYADPSYTRYGTWGDFNGITSTYITSDNDYDDQSSSDVIFHFSTSGSTPSDYPCGARPPNLL